MSINKKVHELAREDYDRGMKIKDIADKYGVMPNTVKTWRRRYKWVTRTSPLKKTNSLKGNQFAVGNRGGAPRGNMNNAKHGMFSKFIPPETLEAMSFLDEKDPLEILWDQIKIQYAAILRAQEIMFVTSKDELIKHIKKQSEGQNMVSVEYEFQFAWDRQATFLNAQSRAMSELRSLIRQYVDMTNADDERKLRIRMMQANLRKVKAEINRLKNDLLMNGGPADEQTVIISGEEEMRKVLEQQQEEKEVQEENEEENEE